MSQDRTKTPSPVPQTCPDFIADALRRMKRDDELVTRPARRTLKQMLPGYERQPILRLAPHVAYDAPCLFCDSWTCPGNCQQFAPASATEMAVAS
jgi:hypothetical protein